MKKKPYDPSKGRQKDALRTRLIAYRAAGGISPLELTTAIVLLDIRNTQKGDCFVHYATIAARVGVSIRTAFRYVEKLAQIGLFSIIPPSGDRTCSTFDFDIHWAPPAPEEPALPPVAERVADYDSRFPGRGSRVVAEALDISQTSVVRARKSLKSDEPSGISVQMHGSLGRSIVIPLEVKGYPEIGTEIPEVNHGPNHSSEPSVENSEPMVEHRRTGKPNESAFDSTANLAGGSAKKQLTTATTVAEHNEPVEPLAAPRRGVSDISIALRAPAPPAAARSRSSETLAAQFQPIRQLWMAKPDGVNERLAKAAFKKVCKDHGQEIADIADHLQAKAKQYIETTVATRGAKYISRLELWLANGMWRATDDTVKAAEDFIEFQKFIEMADNVIRVYDHLERAAGGNAKQAMQALDDFEGAGGMALVEECRHRMKAVNHKDGAYDDEGHITPAYVTTRIARLLASFPTNKWDPPYLHQAMVQAVLKDGAEVAPLEWTCHRLITGKAKKPTIEKVIELLADESGMWMSYGKKIEDCGSMVDRLKKKMTEDAERVVAEKVKEEERRLAAEQKKCVEAELRAANAKLRAQPFAVGDRVRGQGNFYGLGNGTIVARKDYGEIVTFEVVLDSATRLGLSPSHMARLIPGDAGFELNDAKRTEIAQKLVEKDAADELRAQPLVVGDRIRHRTGGGLGTVVGDDVPGQPNCCSLRSDKGRVLTVHRDYLEKLLPGDAGFVPLAVVEVATGAPG